MILSAQSIRKAGIFTPFHERTQHEKSGMTFGLGPHGYDIRIAEDVLLNPSEFALASAMEEMWFDASLCGVVHDKSTWARLGLALQNTVIEAGWHGFLTLELSNHGKRTLTIPQGWPIAQVLVHRLDQPTEQPYEGRYQGQKAGPQPAICKVR